MKSFLVLSFVCIFFASVRGHAYFSSITVDGVAYKEGECMRAHPSSRYDYPISALDRTSGLQSADMTCGWLPAANKAASKKCPVQPGSKITVQWHYEMGMGDSDTFIIDPSHKGPCLIYLANSETGSGNVWFKIFEDGYDQSSKKWCVDKLRANRGKLDFTIPSDLAPGNYLLRSELIALHEGHEMNGAQPYVGCAEITVGGSKTGRPSANQLVAIPGAYKNTDKGIYFNIYSGKNPAYPIPGPALYVANAASGSTPAPPPAAATTAPRAVTTGRPVSVTTGRTLPVTTGASNNGNSGNSNNRVTTGRRANSSGNSNNQVTTGAQTAPEQTSAASGRTSSASSGNTSSNTCSNVGDMRCVTSETYQTCDRGVWQAAQSCNVGTTCSPRGNVIYCV